MENTNIISVFFDDEKPLLQAITRIRESDQTIIDVLTPFPVHGIEKAMGIKPSRLPRVAFIFGAIGGLLGFFFQTWVFTIDYPLIVGGKPFFAVPSFIPVTFECTVLFAGLGIAAAFLIKSKLKPDKKFEVFDERVTDDHFVIIISGEDDIKSARKKTEDALAGIQMTEIK